MFYVTWTVISLLLVVPFVQQLYGHTLEDYAVSYQKVRDVRDRRHRYKKKGRRENVRRRRRRQSRSSYDVG